MSIEWCVMIVNVGTVVNTDVRTMQGERLKMKEEVYPNTFYSHKALPYALPLLVSGCSRKDRTERVYHVPEHWGPKLSRWRVHIPGQQEEDSFIYIYIYMLRFQYSHRHSSSQRDDAATGYRQ